MEKPIINPLTYLNEAANLLIRHTRYFIFLLGFIILIITAHQYNRGLNTIQPLPLKQKPTSNMVIGKTIDNLLISDKIVDYALAQLGVPYTTAGKTPNTGFDCSGFTSYVFKKFGYSIPPTSLTQAHFGEPVSLSSAKKGDLIFFKSPSKNSNQIGHVGIIISHKNNLVKFIHSSSSRGVVIDDLNSSHYQKRFKTIRRII